MEAARDSFNKVAEEYDFVNTLLNDYSFFMSNLSLQKGRALDIGSGSGILVDKLSSHFDEVVGIDISDEMLSIAKTKRQRANTSYLHMDAENLIFEQKFDFIVSRTTFHHLNHLPNVLEQMKSLLNDDGKIVILDNVSEVETPATYVYVIGAMLEFIPHIRKFGLKNASRIFRHNTSKPWLEHLASDKYISEKQYYDLYGKLLPNCRFQKMGWAMGVIWEKDQKSSNL
ncbi:class I SAM-dependent methyltransferase [Paenibacillus agilis]|uniref:Methyltransferase domain-containing protein n=1 Tax=Paenibacillus agilis TaxID=3020863 RepID=A0A559J1L1_9BACL|nr:class I SAM-dependent methyltransferase [Paenibacillus agilis]TVX93774.1 methyltransferase domain-containing protein [Paenibacillus agilis]